MTAAAEPKDPQKEQETEQQPTEQEQATEATTAAGQDEQEQSETTEAAEAISEQAAATAFRTGFAFGIGYRQSLLYGDLPRPVPDGTTEDQGRQIQRDGYRNGREAALLGAVLVAPGEAEQYEQDCFYIGFGNGYADGRMEWLREHPEDGA